MFRDYPNMSYVMCENTEAALNQIMDAMDELRSFNEILHIAQQFVGRAERALDRVADDRVNEVFEGDE